MVRLDFKPSLGFSLFFIFCVDLVIFYVFLENFEAKRVKIMLQKWPSAFITVGERFSHFSQKRSLHVTPQNFQKRAGSGTFWCVFVPFWFRFEHVFGKKIKNVPDPAHSGAFSCRFGPDSDTFLVKKSTLWDRNIT